MEHKPPDCDDFFKQELPSYYNEKIEKAKNFVKKQLEQKRSLVLVTSGGTIVPLEKNMVRYLDNFSEGKRGASSTEYFLEQGYSVIFLTRKHSLQPFSRHFMVHDDLLDLLHIEGDSVTVKEEPSLNAKYLVEAYSKVKKEEKLLTINFLTVVEYLFLLKGLCECISILGRQAIVYLAAAVSDFYLPPERIATHKIQSGGPLQLTFADVPKMVRPLRDKWCPQAYIVTFKLETDVKILEAKCKGALEKYEHQLVVGNLLQNYHDEVNLFQRNESAEKLRREKNEIDLERALVSKICSLHKVWK
eukprot:TRINITY_DN723_c0_g1_i1.p1 TRINITY_DN723_c0_g1~~TRINITY_DN723_c0_g1_i1.p1  ORF type:complete len:303 (-),score=39.42 TRINITY_DN723_c0_g1_i1:12-920(-)